MGRAFVLSIVAFAGACHLAFPIDPQADAGGDTAAPGSLPRVFTSPSPAASLYGGYPQSFSITLAADDPTTIIYYTTDGSEPGLSSTSSITPIAGIPIATTSTVRYFGVNGAGRGPGATEIFTVDATAQSKAGYLVTSATLDGASPVVKAGAGDLLAVRANLQIWVQSACPTCAAQLVYGFGTADHGCAYDADPGVYPGATTPGVSFSVTAPTTSGVHELRVAHIEEVSCAQAMATMALLNRPTVARIGVVVVP